MLFCVLSLRVATIAPKFHLMTTPAEREGNFHALHKPFFIENVTVKKTFAGTDQTT